MSRSELVSVDVLVTNGRRPVSGLTAADFELLDNGVCSPSSSCTSSSFPQPHHGARRQHERRGRRRAPGVIEERGGATTMRRSVATVRSCGGRVLSHQLESSSRAHYRPRERLRASHRCAGARREAAPRFATRPTRGSPCEVVAGGAVRCSCCSATVWTPSACSTSDASSRSRAAQSVIVYAVGVRGV